MRCCSPLQLSGRRLVPAGALLTRDTRRVATPALAFAPDGDYFSRMLVSGVFLVRDNGKRGFIPPSFSWDLIIVDSEKKIEASELDLSPLGLTVEEERALMYDLASGRRRVRGTLSPVGPPPGIEPGLKLTVLEVCDDGAPSLTPE